MWTYQRVLSSIREDPELLALHRHAKAQLDDDPAHDTAHCVRVAAWTLRLSERSLDPRLAIAAALLHDIVNVPKDSPERVSASELSARAAGELLPRHGFTDGEVAVITAAIRTHSFSRGEKPTNELGRLLSDADRLEALGAIGLFRTISTGVRMGALYFDADDPWAMERPLDDRKFSIDHFFTKLLRLPQTLCTDAGRAEAARRVAFLHATLEQLAVELGADPPPKERTHRSAAESGDCL
jgi:uncharacterized protein